MNYQHLVSRLWAKDASLWSNDENIQSKIQNRLGWLTCAEQMAHHLPEITHFVESVRADGFKRVLLLGMGGSSLAPEVFYATFGATPGYPTLAVMDTTDPASILQAEREVDLQKTLFLVSTKSGTTIETVSLFQYFYEKVGRAGHQFAAITDPGSKLENIARQYKFRYTFFNPVDIGGRYSALSYFGLVPAALIGVNLERLLASARRQIANSVSHVPAADNQAAQLGLRLAQHALAGRDKMTLIASPPIASLGYWIEQLIAESTGKNGKSILPVEGEPLGNPEVYSKDRVFVYLRLDNSLDAPVSKLKDAGQPVIQIDLTDRYDLGAEFFRWEIATAVAGAAMGINPFDEPNVTESKNRTTEVLASYKARGALPEETSALEAGNIHIFSAAPIAGERTIGGYLKAFLQQARPSIDYVALMAYFSRSHEERLQSIRLAIRNRLRLATTLGYGPRFLHSTGQLHKGGKDNGLFIQMTTDDAEDLPIPGESYGFGTLKRAQALGDFRALCDRGRRIIRLHLSGELDEGLEQLKSELEALA
jgi:glucose-6-phosphate isomerase